MRVSQGRWQIKDADFGPLLPYIKDENVTDIDYNGSQLWVEDLTRGRYNANETISADFIERFTTRIADTVSAQFNQASPLLEAETDTLRISIVHESCVNTGRSICIRKTPIVRRLSREKMLADKYATEEALAFLENCILAKMSVLMCGLPATGKTEFLKYLTSYIHPEDRAITIEDNLEIHYPSINPGCDCVEMKVSERFPYTMAIKACLRQNPKWILLSEARSAEVRYLIESMSTGTHCLTTIHTDDVRKVPDRIKNMCGDSVTAMRIENDVYSFLDVAVLVKKVYSDNKIIRHLDQICVFSREGSENVCHLIMDEGKIISKEFPPQIAAKFRDAHIEKPFVTQTQIVAEKEELLKEMLAEREMSVTDRIALSKKYDNSVRFTFKNHVTDNEQRKKRAQTRGDVF